MENILNEELKRIKCAIKYNDYAYLFVISNDDRIRNYFASHISAMEEVCVTDSLLMKYDEFNKKFMNNKGLLYIENRNNIELEDSSLYLNLVLKKDFLRKKRRTIIVVCNEEIVKSLLSSNNSLTSVSRFYFMDDITKTNKNYNFDVLTCFCDKAFVVAPFQAEKFKCLKPNCELKEENAKFLGRVNNIINIEFDNHSKILKKKKINDK